jgi:hypothetical protein
MIAMGRKRLLAVAFISLMLPLVVQVPIVGCPDFSAITKVQEFLNAANIDTSPYNLTVTIDKTRNRPDLANLQQEYGIIDFVSNDSYFSVVFSFINGSLFSIALHIKQGSLFNKRPCSSTSLELASDFLENYKTISNDPIVESMKYALTKLDAAAPTKVIDDNIELDVSYNSDSSWSYVWKVNYFGCTYGEIAIRLQNNTLVVFRDTRSYLKIGDPTVRISEEQAISLASDFIEKLNLTVQIVHPAISARLISLPKGDDPLTIYPCWEVSFPYVSEQPTDPIVLRLFAGTGEVRDCLYPAPDSKGERNDVPEPTLEPFSSNLTSIDEIGFPSASPTPFVSLETSLPPYSVQQTTDSLLSTPSPQPTRPGFLGTNLPTEYGYAIVVVLLVGVVGVSLLLYFRKRKRQP